MTDRELLEYIAAQVGKLTQDVGGMKDDVGGLKSDVSGLKDDVGGLKSDVSGLKNDVGGLKSDVSLLKSDVESLKEGQKKLENITIRIEQNHGQKLDALFDGYKQNASRLDRIEAEVTKQEEIIMRRVK